MVIVSYDISDDKLRTKFSKFLSKYGYRLQYSVFEINNSQRILSIVVSEIRNKFEKKFSQNDSVVVFHLSKTCKIDRYGYAKNDDDELIVVE